MNIMNRSRSAIVATFLCAISVANSMSLKTFWQKGNAAWVLPMYSYNNQKYVLLGREAGGGDKGTYDAFGGKKDPQDDHPTTTAAREFEEEAITAATLGWNLATTKNYVKISTGNTSVVICNAKMKHGQKSGPWHATYLTNFSLADINKLGKNFHNARKNAKSWKYKEKDELAVVTWSDLVTAVNNKKQGQPTQVQALVLNHKGVFSNAQQITLRPVLVKNLSPYVKNKPYTTKKTNPIARFYQ